MTAKEIVLETKLIAIMRRVPENHLAETARALCRGGVRAMEITFDHERPDCARALARQLHILCEAVGDQALVGAGTVLTPEEVDIAAEAGARLIVSPNTDENVIRRTKERGLLSCPGAMTPSEIVAAHAAGADIVKLFPVQQLDASFIKAMRGPLGHIPLLAVGGTDETNAAEFVRAGACGVGVGGALVRADLITAENWGALEENARRLLRTLHT